MNNDKFNYISLQPGKYMDIQLEVSHLQVVLPNYPQDVCLCRN